MDQIVYPDMQKEPVKALSIRYSMPEWIIRYWLNDYDMQTVQTMLESFLTISPLTIRVQFTNGSKEELLQRFAEDQITAEDGSFMSEALKNIKI